MRSIPPTRAGVIGEHVGLTAAVVFPRPDAADQARPKVRALVAGLDRRPLQAARHAVTRFTLCRAVSDAVPYTSGHTDVETTAEAALAGDQGVCQDHAHIFIGAARAARSAGALCQRLSDDGRPRRSRRPGTAGPKPMSQGSAGSASTYRTRSVPMNAMSVLATGCDYRDAAPVTGVNVGGGQIALEVSLAALSSR